METALYKKAVGQLNEKPAGLKLLPRRYWWGAFFAFTLSTLGIIMISGAGLKQSAQVITAMKSSYLAAAAALLIGLWLLEAARMKAILALLGERLPVKDIVQVNLAFGFAAAVTPAAGGGPPAYAYLFYLKGIAAEKAVAAVSARTLLAVGSISFLNPLLVFSFRNYLGLPALTEKLVLAGAVSVSTGIFVFLFLSLRPQLIFPLLKCLPEKTRINSSERIARFSSSLRSLLFTSRKSTLIFILALSFLYWGIFFSIGWVLAVALGGSVAWPAMVARQMVLHFLLAYVPLPGASGVAEVSYAVFFTSFVPAAALPALVAGWRFFTYYLNIIIGGILFWWLIARQRKSL
ncbi:MAG: lysylphosphatidylglycerol synthase transmembrane domain-containing protein [Bacillota bacterium]